MNEKLKRARVALEGLSVGDALGERYFGYTAIVESLIEQRGTPQAPWHWTDDTNMALSIYENLRLFGEIQQDNLAYSFAQHFERERGYGGGAAMLLRQIQIGLPWRELSAGLFSGSGSYGNGAAMRIAPLGAYFSDDIDTLIEQAKLASEVTHANPEGIAGGIAIAVGTAVAIQLSQEASTLPSRQDYLDAILSHVPDSVVREKIRHARNLDASASVELAVFALGNGSAISAQDTVAYCLWCAGGHLNNYVEAFWTTVSGYGDIDTNCAIVGGIVASVVGIEGIPQAWRENREPLPDWAFGD